MIDGYPILTLLAAPDSEISVLVMVDFHNLMSEVAGTVLRCLMTSVLAC
ncbi:hypothetical protein [Aestuariirhabdus sp. LZHN29]